MVSHQKACSKAIQLPAATMVQQLTTGGANSSQIISHAGSKRPYFKVVLNSEEIKSLIDAKDEEIKLQEQAVKQAVQTQQLTGINDTKRQKVDLHHNDVTQSPIVIVSAATSTTLNVNPTVTNDEDDDIAEVEVDDYSKLINGSRRESNDSFSGIKPVVRKRAPIFPFEAEDHYVPDNNSNNVINKLAINPPPSEAENRQGFCLRQFKGNSMLATILSLKMSKCVIPYKHLYLYLILYNPRHQRMFCLCRWSAKIYMHDLWQTLYNNLQHETAQKHSYRGWIAYM